MNVGKRFTFGKMKNELKNGRGVENWPSAESNVGGGGEKICGVLECGMRMTSPTLISLFYAIWFTNDEWK